MRRKVLLIAPQPFFSTRGTPINVRALAETLAARNEEVHLLVYPFGDEISLPGVKIHRCLPIPGIYQVPVGASWRKVLLDIPFSFSALLLALRHKFSVFHGIEEGGFIAGTLGLLFSRPYVYDMDSCMVDQLRTGKFRKLTPLISTIEILEKFFLKRANAILTVATPLSEKARSIAPQVPLFQIEDFPMDSATSIDESILQKLRAEYQSANEKILLYTGNFEYYQGVELGLQAWHAACEANPNFSAQAKFLLVGGTPEQIQKLRSLAQQLGIDSSTFFLGPRPPEEMGSFQALADALFSPRIVGGNTPLKLFTYMASGVPIVATEISAHTHVLDQSSCFLAPPEAAPLGKALIDGLFDSSRNERAQRAKYLVNTRYSKSNFQDKLNTLYNTLFPKEEPLNDSQTPNSPTRDPKRAEEDTLCIS